MTKYTGNTFIGQKLKLDGSEFTGNIFKNCILVYGGGPLHFSGNSLDNTKWEFVDNAARTIGLLSSFYQSEGSSKEFVELLLSTFGKKVEQPEQTGEE